MDLLGGNITGEEAKKAKEFRESESRKICSENINRFEVERQYEKKMAEEVLKSNLLGLDSKSPRSTKKKVVKRYQDAGKANEYGERDKWFANSLDNSPVTKTLSKTNLYWADVLHSVMAGSGGLFLSENFM